MLATQSHDRAQKKNQTMNPRLKAALARTQRDRWSRVTTLDEASAIREFFGELVPEWYLEVLMAHPLAGTSFMITSDVAGGPLDFRIEWLDAKKMIAEARDLYPGISAMRDRYVPVGGCLTGSGDPYFVRFTEGDDPQVMQMFHDMADVDGGMIGRYGWVVADSLSDFFERARV
jgi:hypothetical protein